MQVGTLIVFLSYLLQILMSVMMATVMAVMIPHAAASGNRIGEVLRTESSIRPPLHPIRATAAQDGHRRGELQTRMPEFGPRSFTEPIEIRGGRINP